MYVGDDKMYRHFPGRYSSESNAAAILLGEG